MRPAHRGQGLRHPPATAQRPADRPSSCQLTVSPLGHVAPPATNGAEDRELQGSAGALQPTNPPLGCPGGRLPDYLKPVRKGGPGPEVFILWRNVLRLAGELRIEGRYPQMAGAILRLLTAFVDASTVTQTDMPTLRQRDEISSPNGSASLKHEGARSGAESDVAHAIPVLSDTVVNVASVPQRSPLRYPGGKTWLVPEIRKYLAGLDFRPEVFVEPFAGGGIASLTAVMDCYVDRAVLCERDPDISNLWQCMLDDAEELARRVEGFVATPENVNAVFADAGVSGMDAAFRTLLRNRVSRGGIMAKGASVMKQGENGHGISSRWYPDTLAARIRAIGNYAERLDFFQGDGVSLVELCKDNEAAAFFIDPPYTAAGKRAGRRLYTYNEIDHEDLFERMSLVRGVFMMTYDESPDVIEMARRRGFHLAKVPMKNTHHAVMYELLIMSHGLTS